VDEIAVAALTRAGASFLVVIVVGLFFAASGIGGLIVPLMILGIGVALAKHEKMPDGWRLKDAELDAWLESGLPHPDSDKRSR
jgi:hypothetical protein